MVACLYFQCTHEVSIKEGDNSSYCSQHQKCSEDNKTEQLAIELVDQELKQLRQTFIYFTQNALNWEDLTEMGPIDARLVMGKILESLIESKGGETPSSITDTKVREMILCKVARVMIDEEKFDVSSFEYDLEDFPLYEQLTNEKREAWLSIAAQLYVKEKKIPVTRILEENNRNRIVNFLKSLINQHFDQLLSVHYTESDQDEIDQVNQLIISEVSKAS